MRELKWKPLSTKYVYEDRWLRARADSCELPDGRIIEPYYVVELPDWCNTVVVTKDEKIVLVKQYRYPVDQVTFELPGGMMAANETPMQAACREVLEETGYVSDEVELLLQVAPNPAINNNTAYFFLARNAMEHAPQQFDAFEDLEVVTFSKEEIILLLKENRMQHGVQVGAMYEALIRLGWLSYTG